MDTSMVYVSRQNVHSRRASSRFFPEKSVRSAYLSNHGFSRPSETEDMLRVRASVMVDGLNHLGNRMIHTRLLCKAWMAWVLRFRVQLVARDALYRGYRRRQWALLRKYMHSWKQILHRQINPRMEYLQHFCFRRMMIRCMRAAYLSWRVYCRSRRTSCLYIVRGYYAYRRRHNAMLHRRFFSAWLYAWTCDRSATDNAKHRLSNASALSTVLDGAGMNGVLTGAKWAFRLWRICVFSSRHVATAMSTARRRQADATTRVLRCFRTAREYVFLVLSFRHWFALTQRRMDAEKHGDIVRLQNERWLLRICLLRWSTRVSSKSSDEISKLYEELQKREAEWREETHVKVREAFAENNEKMNEVYAKMSEQTAEIKALKEDYQQRVRKLYEQVEQREAEANSVCKQKERETNHLRTLLSGHDVSEIEGTLRKQEVNLIKAEMEENNEMLLARERRAMEEEMVAMQEHTQRERRRISSELLETQEFLVRMTEQDRMTSRETQQKIDEVRQPVGVYQGSHRGKSGLTATEAMRLSRAAHRYEQPEDAREENVLVSDPAARHETRQMFELFEDAPPSTTSRMSLPTRDSPGDLRTRTTSAWRDAQGDARQSRSRSTTRVEHSQSTVSGRDQVLEYLDRARERSTSPVDIRSTGYASAPRSSTPPQHRGTLSRRTSEGSLHRARSQGSSASRRRVQGDELASPYTRDTRLASSYFAPANRATLEMRERSLTYGRSHDERAVPEDDTRRTQQEQEGHRASYNRRGTFDALIEGHQGHVAPITSYQQRGSVSAPIEGQEGHISLIVSSYHERGTDSAPIEGQEGHVFPIMSYQQRGTDSVPIEEQEGHRASIPSSYHQRNTDSAPIEEQEGHRASIPSSYHQRNTDSVPIEKQEGHRASIPSSYHQRGTDSAPIEEQEGHRASIPSSYHQGNTDSASIEEQEGHRASIPSSYHQRNTNSAPMEGSIASCVSSSHREQPASSQHSYHREFLPSHGEEGDHSRETFPPLLPPALAREERVAPVPERKPSVPERKLPYEQPSMLPQAIGHVGRGHHVAADVDEHLVVSICSQTFSYVPDPADNLIEIALANFHNCRVNKMFFAKVSSGSYFYGRIHCRLQEVGNAGSGILMVETATSGTFGLQEFVEKYEMMEFLAAEARFLEEEKRKRRKKKREKKQKEQEKIRSGP